MKQQTIKVPVQDEVYRILGIDPGTNYMGYGILEVQDRTITAVVLGAVDLHKLESPYDKLRNIFTSVNRLVKEYEPKEIAIESPFFGNNIQSMLKLGRAQGVAMAAALMHDCTVAEYAPRRIKQAIAGIGSATKEQVASVVMRTLKLKELPKKLDATDGMAVALCHYYASTSVINNALGSDKVKGLGGDRLSKKRGSSSWEQFLKENPDREIKNTKI